MAKAKSSKKNKKLSYITVTNKGYGNRLKNLKVYYENSRPKGLRDDGAFKFGKNLLELLQDKFATKFKLILTNDKDGVVKVGSVNEIRISNKTLNKINSELFNRTKDIKVSIIEKQFSNTHPGLISKKTISTYAAGRLNSILDKAIIPKLSASDRDSLDKFIPEYISTSHSASALVKLNAKTQLKTLKQFASDLRDELPKKHSEPWWQDYIKANILIIQQGYIKAIDNFNTGIGGTKYPDFLLVTHDNFLDVLEIKKPDTKMLLHDESRDNYYFDKELSKALIQTENYITQINANGATVRTYLEDKKDIKLQVVRPRGIILAGNSSELKNQKMKDDFRTLTQSMKNIIFITYDDLLVRLENYIAVLEAHSKGDSKSTKKSKK